EAYIEAFLANIHWGRVADRFNQARRSRPANKEDTGQISIEELKARIDAGDNDPLVLDVRHDDDRERYTSRIMTSAWRNSFEVEQWADECPKDKLVVVYCMYGFWISQKVAEELRTYGIDARSLEGGITAWRAMSLASTDIPAQ
ncbi:MAG: hypothetical protein KAG20_11320, partial [Cocleimonas sp.]|nr:hypothetical protein [Cocleimonas sp.]